MERAKVIKLWSKHNLPAHLWPEILSRLPVRSLVRFLCVSKSWRSLIKDPDFCHLHLNNFKNDNLESHLFVNQYGGDEQSCVVRCNKSFKTITRLDCLDARDGCTKTFPTKSTNSLSVVCSLDGLVLLSFSKPTLKLTLWNPSNRRARTLHVSIALSEEYVDLGLGFNPASEVYKLVRLLPHGENDLRSIAVYTVGVGSWRKIQFQDSGGSNWHWTFHDSYAWKTVCCRGLLYFTPRTIISNDKELVSFDLSTEVFASTSFPVDDDAEYFRAQAP